MDAGYTKTANRLVPLQFNIAQCVTEWDAVNNFKKYRWMRKYNQIGQEKVSFRIYQTKIFQNIAEQIIYETYELMVLNL